MTVEVRGSQGAVSVADRSRFISESLRQMARVSRFADARTVGRTPYAAARRKRDVAGLMLLVCLFVLPTLAGLAYFGLIASDRFITEARFAIRPAIGGVERAAPDPVGTTLGIPQAMILQDTVIVTEYIHSRPMIEALERVLPLRAMFSRPEIDYPSRFNPEKPIERFVKYWQNRVEVGVESHSGIVTVKVNAFSPEESLALTRAIIAESERMINELTVRARTNALAETQRELALAESRLTRVRGSLRDLRNKDGVLDAQRTAEATLKMLSELRGQRIQLALRQGTLARDLSPEARSMQELQSQIGQLDDTMAKLERATTAQSPQEKRVLSETLGSFEALEVERKNAERYYGQVISAHERSKIIADRQMEFFSSVVEPVLAGSAQAPRRLLSILVVAASAAALFLAAMFGRKFVAA